jgi:hypothetical protein
MIKRQLYRVRHANVTTNADEPFYYQKEEDGTIYWGTLNDEVVQLTKKKAYEITVRIRQEHGIHAQIEKV